MRVWRRLVSKIRESGPLYTLQLLAERVVPKSLLDIRVVILCELDLGDALNATQSDPDIHLAKPDEFDRLVRHHGVLSGMRTKLGPATQLWVLEEGDEIGAFMWLNPHVLQPSDWLRIELSEDSIAGVFLWVSPERRGTGLGPLMNRHVSHECARAGHVRIVSTVDSLNRNSLRADEKVGYRRIGKILVLRIFGFGGIFCNGMSRLGWWTSKHPLVVPVEEVERSLCRAR
jgi:GNAT superfamily N-acetyltransferase